MRSRKAAVDAFCRHCIYDPYSGEGNWRQQVGACTSVRCPLYEVRPVSKPKAAKTLERPVVVENDAKIYAEQM